MKSIRKDRDEFYPSAEEVVAAFVLGAVAIFVSVFLLFACRDTACIGKVAFVASPVVVLVGWIGGRALLRLQTWIVTVKIAASVMIMIGLMTLITAQHPEGPFKIWRKVDRDSDLEWLIAGLAIWGVIFLAGAVRKAKKGRREDSRTRRYRQPR